MLYYTDTVHKTLAIISQCHLMSVNISMCYFTLNLFIQAKQWFVIEPTQLGWRTSKLFQRKYRACFDTARNITATYLIVRTYFYTIC